MSVQQLRKLVPFLVGLNCPLCGRHTERERTPRRLRVFRVMLRNWTSYRICLYCKYRGLAFHPPRPSP